eukprot:g9809.t1
MQQAQAACPKERGVGGRAFAASEHMVDPAMRIPIFLDRAFSMVERGPADVICWSRAGDSFIIKQVRLFEELLPSYYNNKFNKFKSFVRQLNFYGFQQMKGKASSRFLSSSEGGGATLGAAAAVAATAAEKESESWAEFKHPQFRRGRRDLLGVTWHREPGRLKRKQADVRKSDIINTLATDVITVSGDLKRVNHKLDDIMSLLLSVGGGKKKAAPGNTIPMSQEDNFHRDDGAAGAAAAAAAAALASFGGGAQDSSTAPLAASAASTATARRGLSQRRVSRDGGHDPYACGALVDYRPTSGLSVDYRPQQEWQGHPLHSQLPEELSLAERYPVAPNQARYDAVQPHPLPALGAVVEEACAPESTSIGRSYHQLPPLRFSPPRASEGAISSPSPERKHGGERKGKTSASADGDAHDAQRQQQRGQREQGDLIHLPAPPQHSKETASNDSVAVFRAGGRCVALVSQMRQGRFGGATSMI